jgi:hypothetical protein
MTWPKRRHTTLIELQLKRENHELGMRLLRVNSELATKTLYASRLEVLLRERLAKVDELNAKLETARAANHRLEQECEHLAAMVAAPLIIARVPDAPPDKQHSVQP